VKILFKKELLRMATSLFLQHRNLIMKVGSQVLHTMVKNVNMIKLQDVSTFDFLLSIFFPFLFFLVCY